MLSGIPIPASALAVVVPASPGAGLQMTYTFPSGSQYVVLAFKYRLTTSGVAGNRYHGVAFWANNGATPFEYEDGSSQPAGIMYNHRWVSGSLVNTPVVLNAGGANYMSHGLPYPMIVNATDKIETNILGMDAADTVTSGVLYYIRQKVIT